MVVGALKQNDSFLGGEVKRIHEGRKSEGGYDDAMKRQQLLNFSVSPQIQIKPWGQCFAAIGEERIELRTVQCSDEEGP